MVEQLAPEVWQKIPQVGDAGALVEVSSLLQDYFAKLTEKAKAEALKKTQSNGASQAPTKTDVASS